MERERRSTSNKVTDYHLESVEANNRYKEVHHVEETPQILIDGERIGGYDDLREHLGLIPDPGEGETYQPVIAIFAVTLLMAFVTTWAMLGSISIMRVVELFIAFSMCVLGIQKSDDDGHGHLDVGACRLLKSTNPDMYFFTVVYSDRPALNSRHRIWPASGHKKPPGNALAPGG